jgi:hypothetical protein
LCVCFSFFLFWDLIDNWLPSQVSPPCKCCLISKKKQPKYNPTLGELDFWPFLITFSFHPCHICRATRALNWRSKDWPNRASITYSSAAPASGTSRSTATWRLPMAVGR